MEWCKKENIPTRCGMEWFHRISGICMFSLTPSLSSMARCGYRAKAAAKRKKKEAVTKRKKKGGSTRRR
jgi:hypothetical protein